MQDNKPVQMAEAAAAVNEAAQAATVAAQAATVAAQNEAAQSANMATQAITITDSDLKKNGKVDNEIVSDESNMLFDVHYHYDYSYRFRWIMLGFGIVFSFLVGPVFMNWPPLREIVTNSGAYSTLCSGTEESAVLDVDTGLLMCQAREVAISGLAGFSVSVMFAFSFVAGVFLDILGSKITTGIGLSSLILGWALFALASVDIHTHKAALFFIAAGTDPTFFGVLSFSNLFPTKSSTILAVFGAFRSISFTIPIILRAIYSGSGPLGLWAWLFMGLLILLLCASVYILPFKAYPKVLSPANFHTVGEKESRSNSDRHLEAGVASAIDVEELPSYRKAAQEKPQFTEKQFRQEATLMRSALVQVLSIKYMLFLTLPIILFIRNNYFTMSLAFHLPDAENFLSILNPLSFIPCPVLGYLADRVAGAFAMFIVSTCAFMSMVLVVEPSVIFLQFFSAIFNWIVLSFLVSQYYCYIAGVYPQYLMGRLVGIALLVGGLMSNLAEPMYSAAEKNDQYLLFDLIVVGLCLFAVIVTVILLRWELSFKKAARKKRLLHS